MPKSKFTYEDVEEWKRLYKSGLTYREIALKYGANSHVINRACIGETKIFRKNEKKDEKRLE